MLHSAETESIRVNSHRVILCQCNFSSGDQLDISLVQYDTHLFFVIFPLALQFSRIFIFRSHRDNFIKFLKIITVSFFLVNNSRQFCTKYFCSHKRRFPVKSPEGDKKTKEITSIIYIPYVYFFSNFFVFRL